MCFGGRIGAKFNLVHEGVRLDHQLFAETAGCFVAEVDRAAYQSGIFDAIEHCVIGITTEQQRIVATNNDMVLFDASLDDLLQIWQQPMKKVFNS
jgi:phosphoribosylformylglycinamidine (FGAM) synthase-like enzyme